MTNSSMSPCILDQFSRESFQVKAALGEISQLGWVRPPFGLFLEQSTKTWIIVHLPEKLIFCPQGIASIDAACEAVLALEKLPIDWLNSDVQLTGVQLVEIMKILSKAPQ